MVMALAGKRALITGAASGIGRATFDAFEAAGATVIGLDIAPPPELADQFVKADLADEAAVIAAVAEARQRHGRIDLLVNSAGICIDTPLAELSLADFDRMYQVNVRGTVLVAREALPAIPEGGRIINLASELAYLGRANVSAYVATKAAVLGLTRSWARELAPKILVNAVAPGPTDTALLDFKNLPHDVQALELANPLGRLGRPEEVAAVILFLATPAASFVTGQCYGADGGAAMR
jgi:3-oxoacyl-[acyl-carrier protein] reductase